MLGDRRREPGLNGSLCAVTARCVLLPYEGCGKNGWTKVLLGPTGRRP